MPSKSRKKMKGQARKAKAKAAAATTNAVDNVEHQKYSLTNGILSETPDNSFCDHGNNHANKVPAVCAYFINTFFKSFFSTKPRSLTKPDMLEAVVTTLETTYNKFPEALNKVDNRGIVKKNLVSNGVSYLLGESRGPSNLPLACAVTLMLIDTYDPSSPVVAGTFDTRDAKNHLRNVDIVGGCTRSLVKYFVKQAPCNCLDELYSKVKSTMPKIGSCKGCHKEIARSELYICMGCERITYCSKACQIANVPAHKKRCKNWQRGN